MAFAKRWHSKGRIDRAGKELITLPPNDPAMNETLEVINNWRACHGFPLQSIKMTLLMRAKKVSTTALIAQRLKRLHSISVKLRDNPNMKLSQMQDMGGCRAVLRNMAQVDRLVEIYEKSRSKNPKGRPEWANKSDYITNPKDDGYRSIHLIYKYRSLVLDKRHYNDQRIEIQIRTALQHAWATAVEIAQTFTGQAMKSKIKTANATWLRFFALMGSAIAMREKRPLVPNTPKDKQELVTELREAAAKENILQCLIGWGNTIKLLEKETDTPLRNFPNPYMFLLNLDSKKETVRVIPFRQDQLKEAEATYLIAEKESEEWAQVVLVSVESLGTLKKAYPNYFADTTDFVNAVRQEIELGPFKK
jgi:hypothetical protein